MDQNTDLSEDNSPSIITIHAVLCWVCVAVILARLYVRAFMLKTVGVEDYIIIGAMVSMSFSILGVYQVYQAYSISFISCENTHGLLGNV